MIPGLFAAVLLAFPGDGWSNLRHITRDRLYVVVLRSGDCEFGTLSSVGEKVLVLGTDSALGRAIKRSEIARVSDNLTAPGRAAVFSARSSWQDVKAADPKGTEYLHILTKNGEEWKWKQPLVSDDDIAFEGVTVGKADVRYVFYVRSKPLTTDEEYFHQNDLKWLTSIPWVGDLVPARISVLLYNSDLLEDNSPVKCH